VLLSLLCTVLGSTSRGAVCQCRKHGSQVPRIDGWQHK